MIHTSLLALAMGLVTVAPLAAQSLDRIAGIEVLPGWRTPEGRQVAALRVTLAPGWKTYWRAPGDAGIPPQFDWSGSQNVTGVALHWPTPDVFVINGTRSIGYHDEVVIPLDITMTDSGQSATLRGTVEMGICEDICVPVALSFESPLSMDPVRDPAIVAALVDQPLSAAEAGAGKVICTADPIRDGLQVTVTIDLPHQGGSEVVVIESGDPGVWASEATARREGGRLVAVADLVPVRGQALVLDRSALRATVLGESGAVDLRGCTGS